MHLILPNALVASSGPGESITRGSGTLGSSGDGLRRAASAPSFRSSGPYQTLLRTCLTSQSSPLSCLSALPWDAQRHSESSKARGRMMGPDKKRGGREAQRGRNSALRGYVATPTQRIRNLRRGTCSSRSMLHPQFPPELSCIDTVHLARYAISPCCQL